jgi:NTP pyrophosphatase (non-canonical NTP hydrolase)
MAIDTKRKFFEALDLVQEECAEIIQIISKIRRFGLHSYHPADPEQRTNRDLFHDEIGDLDLLIELLQLDGHIDPTKIGERKRFKLEKLRKYTNLFSD